MPIQFFPSQFIYWKQLKKHDEIKSYITEWIDKNDNNYEKCNLDLHNAHTSFDYNKKENNNEFLFNDFFVKNIVWSTLEEMLIEINSNNKLNYKLNLNEHHISDAWYTKYNKGGSFDLHNHYGKPTHLKNKLFYPSFSIIYILNDENQKNTTTFNIINEHIPLFPNEEYTINTGDFDSIKEGTVIIFPSSLYHRVLPSEKSGRITVAYNICSSY
jgi:hypothetical protein